MKRERIKKKIYGTQEEARSDIFDYIEMFYNSKRRHGSSDQMPPTEYENQYYQRLISVWIIRGDSGSLNAVSTDEDIVPDSELASTISKSKEYWRHLVTLT